MALSTTEVFTLKGYGAQQESAAELWFLQQQLQCVATATEPGVLRDAALAEAIQLSMLIDNGL